MRIVGGDLRGRVLKAPAGMDTRPTSEKVREAIFNILPDVDGMQVLDVFAGSGALGIEALSRGAAHATFIDLGKQALATVKANLRELGVDKRATVLAGDAVNLVARHAPAAPWGLVFIDPPYRSDLALRSATALTNLADEAVIVIEYDRRNVPPERIGSLLRTDERRYGDTMVAFYRRETTT